MGGCECDGVGSGMCVCEGDGVSEWYGVETGEQRECVCVRVCKGKLSTRSPCLDSSNVHTPHYSPSFSLSQRHSLAGCAQSIAPHLHGSATQISHDTDR